MGSATAAYCGVVICDDEDEVCNVEDHVEKKLRQKLSATDTAKTHFGNLSARGCPLYVSIRAGLEEYYGQKEFSDPGRQSGWYRVQYFLKWLKRNEPFLQQEKITVKHYFSTYQVPVCRALRKASYKETFTAEQMQGILGVWLGARYTADMFAGTRRERFPYMKLTQESAGRAIIDSNGKTQDVRIEINSDSFPLVKGLNLGLHEGTHLTFWMTGGRRPLGEWGTYLATVHFALPVRAQRGEHTYHGVRSFPHNVTGKNIDCEDLLNEYAAFVLGARLYPTVRQQNFFNFEQTFDYKDGTLLSMLRNMAAAQKNALYAPDMFFSVKGDENSIWNTLRNKFSDCPAVKELRRLESGKIISCGNYRLEFNQNKAGTWFLLSGRPANLQALARSVAPDQLSKEVTQELQSMAHSLGPVLDEIPQKEVSWQTDGIKDLKDFKQSASYTRVCNAVRSYIRSNPTGVPPVPQGYM